MTNEPAPSGTTADKTDNIVNGPPDGTSEAEAESVPERQTLLVQITGEDRPGISAGLLGVLDSIGATIDDMEQVVIRGRLTLGALVSLPGGRDAVKELLMFSWEQKLHVEFEVVEETASMIEPAHVVTVVGATVSASELRLVADAIADGGGNIDRIVRLSRQPVMSYEFVVKGGEFSKIRSSLLLAASEVAIDVAVQPEGLGRRAKRLVVLDVDSTLVQNEVIDLLAAEAGVVGEVSAITEQAMQGHLDFEQSLRHRVKLLAGLPATAVDAAWDKLKYTPGARTFMRTLKRLGFTTAIVSGGFTVFTDRIREELDIDYSHANVLEVVDGQLTGELVGPIVDRAQKGRILEMVAQSEQIPLEQTVAIGDGANDLDMLELAGLGIAFNAKPVVQAAADTTLSVPYLDAILFLLGITREEVEAADL